jgi:hypothetical protein
LPNWNDAASVKKWLEKQKDNGRQEQKAKQEQYIKQTSETPRLLRPLISGEIVSTRPEDLPRQRAEPQERRRKRTGDDRTRVDAGAWRDDSMREAQPGQLDPSLRVPVQGMGLGLPELSGAPLDWVGQGNSPAAKYADWLNVQNRTDAKPELFPGYDNILDATNQWFDAPGRFVTTTPFIPATPEDKRILGIPQSQPANLSLAEGLTFAGQQLNQTFNPFNPNRAANGQEAARNAQADLRKNFQFRTDIDQMTEDQRDTAWRVWTANGQSNNQAQVFEDIINREAKAKDAYAKMQTAKVAGNEIEAARWGQEWNRINNLSEREIIESNQNPWAEIVFGVAFDPVDWVSGGATELLGLTPKLAKAAKAVKAYNIDPALAAQRLDNVVTNSAPVVEKIVGGKDIRGFLDGAMNPFARTGEAKAYLDARNLTETAMVLITGVKDKTQARAIVQNWIDTGGKGLVQGMKMANDMADSQGVYRVGAGVVGNKATVSSYPVLKASAEQLTGMKSLLGNEPFKASEFIPEFAKVIETTARKAYGVTDEMNPAMKALSAPSRFLRAVLVDGYLNLRPANWIRQAASQTANAIGDSTYSLRPIANIVADVEKKTGGLPIDNRFQSEKTFTELADASQGKHWTEMLGMPENPLSKVSKNLGKIWTGDTGSIVPVGEQAFYDKIFGTTFLRSFDGFWADAVAEQFKPAIEAMGLEPSLAQTLANAAIEAGKTGGKVDVITALRKAVGGMVVKDTSILNIPDELMPLELRGALNNIIQTYTPQQTQEALQKIDDIFAQAKQYAQRAVDGGPPSWKPEFTRDVQIDDAQTIANNFATIAKAAGTGAKEAGRNGYDLAWSIIRAEDKGYKAFMDDLAQAQDPKALNFAYDVWENVYELKRQTRIAVDKINQAAIKAADYNKTNTAQRTEIWRKAYADVTAAWQGYGAQFGQTMEQARVALLNAEQGQPLPSRFNWTDTLKRYFDYDEAATQAARGLEAGPTWDDTAEKVIEASRAFQDHYATELFDVLRRFPTVDSLDIIAGVMRQADAIGAQAATKVEKARQAASVTKDWEEYYPYRNELWRKAAEDSVQAFAAAKRAVVWNYLTEQTPTKLRWTDDFAGDFALVGPATDTPGTWLVRDGNGTLVRLKEEGTVLGTTPQSGATPANLNGPQRGPKIVGKTEAAQAKTGGVGIFVPRAVIDDYKRLVNGNFEDAVDDVLEQVSPFTDPGTIAQAAPEVAPIVDDVAEVAQETAPVLDGVIEAAPEVAQNAPITANDVRKTASQAGIGTDKGDSYLNNSIKKNFAEIGLDAPKTLRQMTPEELAKVQDYYVQRADNIARSQWDNPVTEADQARQMLQVVEDSKREIADLIRLASDEMMVTSANVKQMGGQKVADWLKWARKQQDLGDATWMREFDESLQRFANGSTLADLLRKYDDLLAKEPELKRTIKDSEQFITRGIGGKVLPKRVDEIVKMLGEDTIREMGLTPDDLATIDRRSLLNLYEQYTGKSGPDIDELGRSSYFAGGMGFVKGPLPDWMVPRPMRKGMWKPTGNAFSFTPDGDAYESIKLGIRQARMSKQRSMPEMGDAALDQLRTLERVQQNLRENLPQILAGTQNTLTPAQRLQVLDTAAQQLLPAWDNVMRAAQTHARKMGEFAMMDFNDRRNFDTILALALPFHYYFTRSAGNWLQRIAAKPALADFWIETQKAIAAENQRTVTVDGQVIPQPQRFEGSVPNPLKQVVNADWMPDRLQNPLNWTLPFAMYGPSTWTAEIDSEEDGDQWKNQVLQYFTEKAFPWYQAPMYALMDQQLPVKEGERPRLQQFLDAQQLADYFPYARVASYGAQAAGWKDAPRSGFLSTGTEWDPYFVGRTARNETAQGNLTQQEAQYAQQMALNAQQGKDPFTLIPEDQQAAAQAAYDKMVQQTGQERFIREAGSWLTGMSNQFYPEGEQQYQAANQAYREFGYGPQNPGGSKAAKGEVLDQNPELVVGWGNSALAPGATGERPPGASAQISTLYDQRTALYEQRDTEATAAGEAAAKAGGNVYDARNPVYDKFQPEIDAVTAQIEALEGKYPRPESGATPVAGTFPGGMNPEENKQEQVKTVFTTASAQFPYDENATGADKKATAQAKEAFAVQELVKLGYTEEEAKQMYADNKTRNLSEVEKAAVISWENYSKQNAADWQARRGSVAAAYGEEAASLWDQYLDLPKGSDARSAFKDAHPELNAFNLAAFEPNGYKYLSGRYGPDAIMDWALTPKWTDNKAEQEARSAYLDAKPKAWMVDAWVDGRPKPFNKNATSVDRNYGKDWTEAERLFGPDIWEKVIQYRTATGADRRAVRDSLGLKDWLDWWYGLLPEQQRTSALLPASVFRGGGGTTRNGWGGGGGGGGGGYGGSSRLPYVEPREMDYDLRVKTEDLQPWRPEWMYQPPWAVGPDALKPKRTSIKSWR